MYKRWRAALCDGPAGDTEMLRLKDRGRSGLASVVLSVFGRKQGRTVRNGTSMFTPSLLNVKEQHCRIRLGDVVLGNSVFSTTTEGCQGFIFHCGQRYTYTRELRAQDILYTV